MRVPDPSERAAELRKAFEGRRNDRYDVLDALDDLMDAEYVCLLPLAEPDEPGPAAEPEPRHPGPTDAAGRGRPGR